jgi:hypothetical protein
MIIGLGAALAVAIYVTKVPVPFLNKGGNNTEAKEAERNKNWDPNAPLHGKNPPARRSAAGDPAARGAHRAAGGYAHHATDQWPGHGCQHPAGHHRCRMPRPDGKASSADPLGDWPTRSQAAEAGRRRFGFGRFNYFVQAGAFRGQATPKRSVPSWPCWAGSRVSEREQNGRTVFRVRVGPFSKRDDAEQLKGKLDGAGWTRPWCACSADRQNFLPRPGSDWAVNIP